MPPYILEEIFFFFVEIFSAYISSVGTYIYDLIFYDVYYILIVYINLTYIYM